MNRSPVTVQDFSRYFRNEWGLALMRRLAGAVTMTQ
jgi:hypothetical protein